MDETTGSVCEIRSRIFQILLEGLQRGLGFGILLVLRFSVSRISNLVPAGFVSGKFIFSVSCQHNATRAPSRRFQILLLGSRKRVARVIASDKHQTSRIPKSAHSKNH